MTSSKPYNLFRAMLTVSGMTFLSRITGLIRETLTARMLGAGVESDAFFIAFRIPNLLRRLFAEGAFSQAFVPMLSRTLEKDGIDATQDLARKVAVLMAWVLVIVTLMGVIGAPALVWLMAGGLAESPGAALQLTEQLTRWMFPYILLISMVALSAGILNTHRKFLAPAATPVLLNLSFIVAMIVVAPRLSQPVYALAGAVVVGGILQLAVQIPALIRLGYLGRQANGRSSDGFWRLGEWPLALLRAWRNPKVRRILRLMLPATLAVSVSQVSLMINTNIASHLATGSVSWISFADRLMEFPTALLGVALGTVLLPSLSKALAAEDQQRYADLLDWGLRLTCLLAIPAAVALALYAEPLTAVMFHYGKFSVHDLAMTQQAVIAYSVGLIGFVAVKVLAPGFFAMQDIRTPVKIGIVVVIVTQCANFIFVPWFAHAGLPLSIGIGALLNASWLGIGLYRRGRYRPRPGWWLFFAQLLIANLVMAGFLWWYGRLWVWSSLADAPLLRLAYAFAGIGAAAALYFLSLWATRCPLFVLLRKPG